MISHPAIQHAAVFVALAVVCCGSVTAETARTPPPNAVTLTILRSEWARGRELVVAATGGCTLGLHIEQRGRRIIGVDPPAAGTDVVPGDTLLAVNAIAIADGAAFELFVNGLANDAIATVTIERGGETRDVALGCAERRIWLDKFIEGLDAALSAAYDTCLTITQELDTIAGPRTGHAKLRYECAEAKRISDARRPGAADALLYFDIYRRLVIPARYSGAYRERVRGSIERTVELLRREGADPLADRLEKLLQIEHSAR